MDLNSKKSTYKPDVSKSKIIYKKTKNKTKMDKYISVS